MEWMTDDDGEYIFVKAYVVDSKTEVQFKFRVGYGNWWVLCEEYPTSMLYTKSPPSMRATLTMCFDSD